MNGAKISSKKDFVNALPEIITPEDASTIVDNLNKIRNNVNESYTSFDDYFKKLDIDGQLSVKNYVKENQNQIYTTEGVIASSQAARDAQIAQNTAIEQSTFAYKAAAVAKNAFAIAGNMLAFMAISKGISMAVTAIDNFIHSSEKCKERVDALMSSFNSELSTANANAQKVEELADKYEALSSGVNNLGENVSLTTDEYKEYNSIVNDIADMFPQMVQGYTNEGNAILSLRGNVDLLRNSYKEAQLAAYNMLTTSGKESPGDDIVKQYKNLSGYELFDNPDWKLTNFGAAGKKEIASILQNSDGNIDHLQNQINAAAKKNNFRSKEVFDYLQDEFDLNIFSKDITSEDINNVRTQAKTLIQIYNAEIQSALTDVHDLANAFLLTNEDYAKLDEQSQNAASIIINSINQKIADGFENSTDVGNYVDKVVQAILTDPKANDAMIGLFTMDTSNMSVENIKLLTDDYLRQIAEVLHEDQNELKIRLGFESVDALETKYNNAIQSSKNKFGGEDLSPFFTENSINTEKEIDQWIEIANSCHTAAEAKERYLNRNDIENPDFSSNLIAAKEDIDVFTNNLDTLKDSLITLYSGNHSSSDLLSSIQNINSAVKEMDGSLNWEFIESQSNSLELLGDTLEYLSDKYVDTTLIDIGIDVDSDFGQMLKNIVKESLDAETQLESYKNQVTGLTNAYSSLTDIINSFNESGHLSFDQLTTLLEMEPQYLSCLIDQNGQLSLNQEALYNLANLRLNEAEVQAVSQAITELGQLSLQDEQTAVTNNAQAFNDAVSDIGAYNTELADTLMGTSLTAASIRDLNNALNGATENGIDTEQIDVALNNLKTKLNFIGKSRDNLKSSLNSMMGGKSSGSQASPKEETPKEFNWLKTRDEYLQKEHDNIKKILDDETQSYEKQLDAIENLIAKDKERLEASNQALKTYEDQWTKVSAKLSQEDIDNIQFGNDFIGEHTGQYAEDLQEAADIYKEKKSYEEDVANITEEQNEHLRDQVKIHEEIIKAQQDEVKSQMDLLQSKMDLIESQGGVVTERMIQKQISLSEDLMSSYHDEIDNLYEQLGNVDPNSAAYSSLLSDINDCESAIIDCQIQQQEWNEKIMRLPIERIQKYLNMLANIKQDLQNFLDEQSAMGIHPTADQLQQLFDISKEEIRSLLEQQETLKGLLEQYRYGSEKFNDVSQEIQDIDNNISGLIQSQKEWNASILQIPVDQMGKLGDTLSLVSGTLDSILGDYDTALSAVTGVIDRQAESLEDLKSAAEGDYQSKIDPLQEELDLLQKQNDERQTQLDLEQKQYDLDRARNQKTNKVIRDGEMVYEADADAVRNASQGLADAEYNKLVENLGNQISDLEEERDKLLESYDTQIEKLNEIKDKWSSIVDEIQLAANTSKANDFLGQGWQDKILSGNDDELYTLFQGLYENTSSQKTQLEEQAASNERIAEMMNQFVTRYQEGSISYEQAMAGIRELSAQMKDGYSSLEQLNALLGLSGVDQIETLLQNMQASAKTSVDQFSDYMTIVKANADAMAQYTSSWEEMQQNIKDQIAALQKLAEEAAKIAEGVRKHDSSNRNEGSGSSGGPSVNDNHYVASGPGHTEEALAEAIAGGKEILEYHAGGLVGAKDAPSRYIGLLSSKNLSDNEVYGKLLKNEWVMTEEQQKIFDSNIQSILSVNHAPNLHLSSRLSNISEKAPDITINMGDTILEHVSKPDEFARALATQFKPLLRQEMSKL